MWKTVPLSTLSFTVIEDSLGYKPVEQLSSGDSIVLKCEACIIKSPLRSSPLLDILAAQKYVTKRFCVSSDVYSFFEHRFYKFPLLERPKEKHEFKDNMQLLKQLVSGVHEGLQVLHCKYLYSHLDIRLPNICWSNEEPVLIDFDRGLEINTRADKACSRYPNSVMYKPLSNTWTVSNLDYLQLGILVCRVMLQSNEDYHEALPTMSAIPDFVYELLNGRFNKDHFAEWEPMLAT